MKNQRFTFEDDLKQKLKNPKFQEEWKKSETEYQLGRILIEKRLAKKMSQRDLAKIAKTTQAQISRIESMDSNPSLFLLKRIAEALGSKLKIQFT